MMLKERTVPIDDCLVLLAYVSRHRDEEQSIRMLADKCGIAESTLYHMLTDCRQVLESVAQAYGYDVLIYRDRRARNQYDRGRIIDVVRHAQYQ
ncbi:MAG TPA: hypothetical protein PK446_07125 [Methanomassiliicoccaceae archaeon]|nr:hypothetical protein [Methanomassiliicoccaceae archaeon]